VTIIAVNLLLRFNYIQLFCYKLCLFTHIPSLISDDHSHVTYLQDLLSATVFSYGYFVSIHQDGLLQCCAGRSFSVQPWPVSDCINAAAYLTVGACKFDHITPLQIDLHWLRVPEWIQYKLCVLTHHCLYSSALKYLADIIQPVTVIEMRQHLRSASAMQLIIASTQWPTIGDCCFAVIAPCAWNKLPETLQRLPSLIYFRRLLKSYYSKDNWKYSCLVTFLWLDILIIYRVVETILLMPH